MISLLHPLRRPWLQNLPGDIVARIAVLTRPDLVKIRECNGDGAVVALAGQERWNYSATQRAMLSDALLRISKAADLIGSRKGAPDIHAHLAVGSAGRPRVRVRAIAA